MIIENIPKNFQPNYKSNYPSYSSGKNLEELFYDYFLEKKQEIQSDFIYLPVFWTSYYVLNNYGENIKLLYEWLDKLDKNKKYFTLVQYASGIYVKNIPSNIIVFSAGGGGLNLKSNCEKKETFHNLTRKIFYGNTANYSLPLICLPSFPFLNYDRNIYCSFMGRFDTHKCRIDMHNALKSNKQFIFYNSVGFEEYKNILNKSIFTLAPRGYGYTSFRIYEAILAESIPIYIWEHEKILPFADILNWEDFAIIIHSSDINNIPDILHNCDIQKMQAKIKEVKEFFTISTTFDYIVKKLT